MGPNKPVLELDEAWIDVDINSFIVDNGEKENLLKEFEEKSTESPELEMISALDEAKLNSCDEDPIEYDNEIDIQPTDGEDLERKTSWAFVASKATPKLSTVDGEERAVVSPSRSAALVVEIIEKQPICIERDIDAEGFEKVLPKQKLKKRSTTLE